MGPRPRAKDKPDRPRRGADRPSGVAPAPVESDTRLGELASEWKALSPGELIFLTAVGAGVTALAFVGPGGVVAALALALTGGLLAGIVIALVRRGASRRRANDRE